MPTKDTHLSHVLGEMQTMIDRARIRDSGRIRAHKLALAVALVAPSVLEDPKIDDVHKARVRTALAECRALAVGSRPGMQPEGVVDGVWMEDVLSTLRSEVELEIAAQS